MEIRAIHTIVTISIASIAAVPASNALRHQERPEAYAEIGTTIDQMPAALETRYALSAAPAALRANATVYLLDPRKGYYRTQSGTSGVTCVVQRTDFALTDFRNDIYIPICFDAAGTKTYLQVIFDEAALRARGTTPAGLKSEVERRYKEKTYRAPTMAGVSYMEAPVFRTVGPPDLKVHTMSMPHVMFYAPSITNADLGAMPDLKNRSSLMQPFIQRLAIDEESFIIQMTGDAEKAQIVASEKPLLAALCAYRRLLCLGTGSK